MKRYEEKYTIRLADCDEQQRLRFPVLIDLLMTLSNHQLRKTDLDMAHLLQEDRGWVVIQYDFEVSALPKAGETITLWTCAVGYNRFFEYRDFGIVSAEGSELIHVSSQWVILDLKARRIQPADPAKMIPFGAPALTHLPKMRRLVALKHYEESKKYRVRYYDLDTNRHMTNSHYFDWLFDSLPRLFLDTNCPRRMSIKFDREIHYGDEAEVKHQLTVAEDGSVSDFAIMAHGKVSALAQIDWQKPQE